MSRERPLPVFYFSSVAAYTVLVWELLTQFENEVHWIWTISWASWIKWNYIIGRYGALAIQGIYLYRHIYSQHHPYSPSECLVWSTFRTIVVSLFSASVQVTLLVRVCALYDREKQIRLSLRLLHIATVLLSIGIWTYLACQPIGFNGDCSFVDSETGRWAVLTVTTATLMRDLILVVALAGKMVRLSRLPHAPPIFHLVMRDGVWTFMVVTVTLAIAQGFIYSGEFRSSDITLDWVVAAYSFASTRLILNVGKFKSERQTGLNSQASNQFPLSERPVITLTNDIGFNFSVLTQYRSNV